MASAAVVIDKVDSKEVSQSWNRYLDYEKIEIRGENYKLPEHFRSVLSDDSFLKNLHIHRKFIVFSFPVISFPNKNNPFKTQNDSKETPESLQIERQGQMCVCYTVNHPNRKVSTTDMYFVETIEDRLMWVKSEFGFVAVSVENFKYSLYWFVFRKRKFSKLSSTFHSPLCFSQIDGLKTNFNNVNYRCVEIQKNKKKRQTDNKDNVRLVYKESDIIIFRPNFVIKDYRVVFK